MNILVYGVHQNIFLITSKKSCINEYILSRKVNQKDKAKIKTILIPSLNPLLRILYCTLLISFLTILIRKSTVFSPINYGPMFCFTKHYLFLHDLSVWGLPTDIQHRSKLTASVLSNDKPLVLSIIERLNFSYSRADNLIAFGKLKTLSFKITDAKG